MIKMQLSWRLHWGAIKRAGGQTNRRTGGGWVECRECVSVRGRQHCSGIFPGYWLLWKAWGELAHARYIIGVQYMPVWDVLHASWIASWYIPAYEVHRWLGSYPCRSNNVVYLGLLFCFLNLNYIKFQCLFYFWPTKRSTDILDRLIDRLTNWPTRPD